MLLGHKVVHRCAFVYRDGIASIIQGKGRRRGLCNLATLAHTQLTCKDWKEDAVRTGRGGSQHADEGGSTQQATGETAQHGAPAGVEHHSQGGQDNEDLPQSKQSSRQDAGADIDAPSYSDRQKSQPDKEPVMEEAPEAGSDSAQRADVSGERQEEAPHAGSEADTAERSAGVTQQGSISELSELLQAAPDLLVKDAMLGQSIDRGWTSELHEILEATPDLMVKEFMHEAASGDSELFEMLKATPDLLLSPPFAD